MPTFKLTVSSKDISNDGDVLFTTQGHSAVALASINSLPGKFYNNSALQVIKNSEPILKKGLLSTLTVQPAKGYTYTITVI